MAETFRRGKIVDFLGRLVVRKAVLRNQLQQPEFQENRLYTQGQLSAIELIIQEIAAEFDIKELPALDEELIE